MGKRIVHSFFPLGMVWMLLVAGVMILLGTKPFASAENNEEMIEPSSFIQLEHDHVLSTSQDVVFHL